MAQQTQTRRPAGAEQVDTAATRTAPKQPSRPIDTKDFQFASHSRNVWAAVVDLSVTEPDAWLHVDFWRPIEQRLTPGDWIELEARDGSWVKLLKVVRHVRERYIKIAEAAHYSLGGPIYSADVRATGDWRVEDLGPGRRWCLIDPNGNVRREGLLNSHEANVALRQAQTGPAIGRAVIG